MTHQLEDITFNSSQNNNEPAPFIATFILKLYNILNDPKNASIISWSQDGKEFIVKSIESLTNTILPTYFRHNNYQSFIRQLNMYNFIKVKMFPEKKYFNEFFSRENDKLRWIKRRPEKKKKKENYMQNFKENQQQEERKQMIKSSENIEQKLQNIFEELCPTLPTKKVCFFAPQNQYFDNLTLIEPTSKWLTIKQSKTFCSFKSFTSIKFFENVEGNQMKDEALNQQYIPKSITNIMLSNPTAKSLEPR